MRTDTLPGVFVPKIILIAVGGNSLIRAGQKGTVAEQFANAKRTAEALVGLAREGCQLVITHGNGPQVGAALLRSERGADQIPGQTLDVCGASTQGEIGYLLQQSLENELERAALHVPVVTVLTQVLVSKHDPEMQRPTKPVGPFYSRELANKYRSKRGWQLVEDAGRGYRRVVPSPEPIEIIELKAIRDLVHDRAIVIAAGGGGIPVVRSGTSLHGIEAVIDKDRTSALLAIGLGADAFAISTDEDFVYLNYKQPTQCPLTRVSIVELETYYRAGHFPPGNMGPKIESVVRFLRGGGNQAVITSYRHLCDAIAGVAGTQIYAIDKCKRSPEPTMLAA